MPHSPCQIRRKTVELDADRGGASAAVESRSGGGARDRQSISGGTGAGGEAVGRLSTSPGPKRSRLGVAERRQQQPSR
eukprot:13986083-Heterocapsa_arctica.AAC.1